MKKAVILIFLSLLGCSPSYYNIEYKLEGEGRYINDVPFFPQEENYCGPATLASVFNFYGQKVSQEEIAKDVFTPKLKGTITVEMANSARRAGFDALYYKGSIENIEQEINNGHPLILYIDLGYSIFPSGHYLVVVGYNKGSKEIIAYSGKNKDIMISYEKLLRSWEKTGNWTLLVKPKE